MTGVKVTPAMQRALDVLAAGDAHYSNLTAASVPTGNAAALGRAVYWQAADKLHALGFVTITGERVALTDAGRTWLTEYHP